MPLKKQDLINLCTVALENEDLIVLAGRFALNLAISPNRVALDIAKGLASVVLTGLAAHSPRNSLTPSRYASRNRRKMPACDYIRSGMDEDQKNRLAKRISDVFGDGRGDISYNDILSLMLTNPRMKNEVVKEIRDFLESENLSCCSEEESDDDYYDSCSSRSKSCSRC